MTPPNAARLLNVELVQEGAKSKLFSSLLKKTRIFLQPFALLARSSLEAGSE